MKENDVVVSNAWDRKLDFSLDKNLFAYVNDTGGPTTELLEAIRTWKTELVQKDYYLHVKALVKKETGASRIIIFDIQCKCEISTETRRRTKTEKSNQGQS
jgi:hypothetical protein